MQQALVVSATDLEHGEATVLGLRAELQTAIAKASEAEAEAALLRTEAAANAVNFHPASLLVHKEKWVI